MELCSKGQRCALKRPVKELEVIGGDVEAKELVVSLDGGFGNALLLLATLR